MAVQDEIGEGSRQHGGEDSGGIGTGPQALEQGLLGGILPGLDQEGTDDGAENAAHGQRHGQQHAVPAVAGGGGQSEGRQNGADIALVQVSAHAGHVADVITDVVGDGSGVTGIVLGDTGLDLTDEVSTDVSGLGVDTAAHTGKQRHKGRAHAVHDHDVGQRVGVQTADEAQAEEPQRDIKHAETDDGEAHDGAGGERNTQTAVQALGSGLRGAGVGVRGNLHADQAGQHRPDTARQERERRHAGEHLALGQEGDRQQDDEYDHKHLGDSGVLTLQVSVGAGADGLCNLDHLFIALGRLHDVTTLNQCENQRSCRTDKRGNQQVCFHMISLVFLLFFLAAVAAKVLWNFRIHYKKTALYSQISRLFFRKAKKIYDTVRDFDNISFLWFSTGKNRYGEENFCVFGKQR